MNQEASAKAKLFAFLVVLISSMMIIIMAIVKAAVPPDPSYWVGMCGFALLDALSIYFIFSTAAENEKIPKSKELDFSEFSRPSESKGFEMDDLRNDLKKKEEKKMNEKS